MSMIAILLASSLVTVVAVIGLADALTHFLGWVARPSQRSAASLPAEAPTRERLVA